MKFKVLAGLLILSIAFNVAGVVFLILYIDARGDVKNLKKDCNQMAKNLSMIQAAASAQEHAVAAAGAVPQHVVKTALDRVDQRVFTSHLDGTEDHLAVQMPNWAGGTREYTLVVYLHGMGSTMMEPFLVPPQVSVAGAFETVDRSSCILSCSYRKTQSWGTDAAFADVTQNVRHVLQELPFKRIVLAGTSMGGCSALNYAVACPPDIKEKLTGVICVEGAGDLAALYRQTRADVVRNALAAAFGGTPDQVPQVYDAKSFGKNIDKLPSTVKVAVVSVDQDTVVPSSLQFDVVRQLTDKGYKVLHVQLQGGHHVPPWTAYADAYRYVLSPQ
jgi:pimeloyl-ACP methyl ester carboxylesterase